MSAQCLRRCTSIVFPFFGIIRDPVTVATDEDLVWSVLPTAIWEIDFSGALRWIRRLDFKNLKSLKLYLHSHPEAADKCLRRMRLCRISVGGLEQIGAKNLREVQERASELLTAESRADVMQIMLAAYRKQRDVKFDTTILRYDGQLLDVKVHWRFIPDPAHPFERAFVHTADATEEFNLHQRVLLADRLSALGSLTESIAHEINNPLTFVWHHLDNLNAAENLPEDVRAQVQEAAEGIARIRELVKDLGELSGSAEEDVDMVDLHEILDYAIRLTRPEFQHRARIVRDYAAKTATIRAARSSVAQVFVNLIVNAAQAIPPGDEDRNRIVVRTRTYAGNHTMIEIEDTGAGVPKEFVDRAFDRFVPRRPGARDHGMGLPICARVVDSLGGTIDLESEPGGGTLVRVILPQAVPHRRRSTPPAFSSTLRPAPGKRLKILIVDDEIVIGRLLTRLFSKSHDVAYRRSGREAILAMSERDYDVILCDLIMPDMTGMDVYRAARMRAKPIHHRMVFMSGGAFTGGAKEFLDRVPNLRIEKPFDLTTLEELVLAAAALSSSSKSVQAIWSSRSQAG